MKIEGVGGRTVGQQLAGPATASRQDMGADAYASVGRTVQQVGADLRTKALTAEAEEALVNFEREKNSMFFNPENGYLNLQGRDAYEGRQTMEESLRKLQETYSGGLSGTAARDTFNRVATQHVSRGLTDIDRHATRGLQAWEQGTAEAVVENALENSVTYWNDAGRLGEQRALGRAQIQDLAKMQGVDSEALNEQLQNFDSSFYTNAVTAALTESSTKGQELLDKYRDRVEGPDVMKIEAAISRKKKDEDTASKSHATALAATRIINETTTRQEAIDRVNEIEDGDLRTSVMKDTMYRYNQRKAAISEERGAAFESGEAFLQQGGTVEDYKAQNPDAWEKMSPEQQRTLASGATVGTDWVKYSDIITLPKDQLAKVNPADHFAKLAKPQRTALINAVKAARGGDDSVPHQVGRTRAAEVKASIQELFGPSKDLKGDSLRQANIFQATLDEEAQARKAALGRELTSQEFTALLADYTRKVTIERPILWDRETSIKEIPAEDLPVLQRWLRENGIPVNSETLMKAYIDASN